MILSERSRPFYWLLPIVWLPPKHLCSLSILVLTGAAMTIRRLWQVYLQSLKREMVISGWEVKTAFIVSMASVLFQSIPNYRQVPKSRP
jgi:hypothetical protein